jgi:hypothetical protein
LQPTGDTGDTGGWTHHYPATPKDRTAVRPYLGQPSGYGSSAKSSVLTVDGAEEASTGQWKFTHQFSEHGVFYLSVYVCPYDDRTPCTNQDPDKLVPGTGLTLDPYDETGERKEGITFACTKYATGHVCPKAMDNPILPEDDGSNGQVPPSTFTICPQGTENTRTLDNGLVQGSQLVNCASREGFFGPEGAGHIAEKCDSNVSTTRDRTLYWYSTPA